jgi:TonB family protein
LLLFFAHISNAAPLLNGLALHKELGDEQFIGAVFSEQLATDAEALVSSPGEKRIELKILADNGITTRRFSRMWIEGMAINNPNTVLTTQADNMVKFTNLFRGNLQANDHVVFRLLPNSDGINIEVNGALLGAINDPAFFPLLLRTWVGRVPLSSTYRDNILQGGRINADLRFRYDSVQPSEQRIEAVAGWTRPAPAPAQERQEVAAAAPAPRAAVPAPAPVVTPSLALSAPRLNAPQQVQPEPEPAAQPAPPPQEEEVDEPALTAESLLARQFYHSDLLRAVNRNISYPRMAERRRMEGGLRIGVVIDRQGNILSMEWLEEAPHEPLNKEAWSAVAKSAPFSAVPDSIHGDQYEFSVPVNFRLP